MNRSFGTLIEAFSRRHTLVFITALFSVWSAVYGPLGGAFFNVAPTEFNSTVTILHDTWLDWNAYGRYYNIFSYLNAIGVSFKSLVNVRTRLMIYYPSM